MIKSKEATIVKDVANKKIVVKRDFDAPVKQVWKAWTEPDLLDMWWAPKPWKAKTKSMDFREGGLWHYAMVGPDGTHIWCLIDYKKINLYKNYTAVDSFCDENRVKNNEFPSMNRLNEFYDTDTGTKVVVEITFASEADLEKILEVGFEEGFTSALGNLDELLEK